MHSDPWNNSAGKRVTSLGWKFRWIPLNKSWHYLSACFCLLLLFFSAMILNNICTLLFVINTKQCCSIHHNGTLPGKTTLTKSIQCIGTTYASFCCILLSVCTGFVKNDFISIAAIPDWTNKGYILSTQCIPAPGLLAVTNPNTSFSHTKCISVCSNIPYVRLKRSS